MASRTLLLCAGVLGACAAPEPARGSWRQDATSLAWQYAGRTLWALHYGPQCDKPHFHPLALASGAVLTADAPADHRWHHGLWWSWKLLNDVNFWEHERGTGQSAGRTHSELLRAATQPDGAAQVQLRVEYGPIAGPAWLSEQRELRISALQPDGSYHIDWDSRFRALTECQFDRTPPPGEPNGVAHGGYAGLSLRLAQWQQRGSVTEHGTVAWNEAARARPVAHAMAMNGGVGAQPASLAILSHPDNPRSPAHWYAVRTANMTFFTPAILMPAKLRLAVGEELRLRYRVLVQPRLTTANDLQAALTPLAHSFP